MCRIVRSEIRARTAGFTIIEVLVAIAVATISLTAIGALTGITTRGVRSLEQHVALVEAARTLAASLPPRAKLAPGEVTGDLYGNRWRMGVSPFFGGVSTPATDSPWIPEAISIRVQSPSGASMSLETVRLQRKQQ
ncbi:MAG TPA: prepilin-type N-terminal cleavage/methylation domain-containing protein [Pseudolabrys sp.]|nr:prepilin-type N-terminal cleavage/methylation domain-containing protein [Pseudolabrys sp.]